MKIMEHFIMLHSIYRNSRQPLPPQDRGEIQKLVTSLKCRSEIIGTWIYCFAPAEYGLRLSAFGFWFSFKHNAFVYSSYPKGGPAYDESLNEIRARLGSQRFKEPTQ